MKQSRTRRAGLAAAVLAYGMMGSIDWPGGGTSEQLLRGDFTLAVSTAAAGETRGAVRRASCTLIRYYVARYTATTAEAWARSKGATDAEIETARGCVRPQQTALIGYVPD